MAHNVVNIAQLNEPPSREEPYIEPVNGVVQPPVIPLPHRPGRKTNQLQYIYTSVWKPISMHPSAWPFNFPIDTSILNLPDYHTVIKFPMDWKTIKKRLKNDYYWSARECIRDFNLMISNCYTYNKPTDEVVVMAQTLKKLFLDKVALMPSEEVEINDPIGE